MRWPGLQTDALCHCKHLFDRCLAHIPSQFLVSTHSRLAEIPAPVGSQEVMSQLRDYPSNSDHAPPQMIDGRPLMGVSTTSWDPMGAGISANPGWHRKWRLMSKWANLPFGATLVKKESTCQRHSKWNLKRSCLQNWPNALLGLHINFPISHTLTLKGLCRVHADPARLQWMILQLLSEPKRHDLSPALLIFYTRWKHYWSPHGPRIRFSVIFFLIILLGLMKYCVKRERCCFFPLMIHPKEIIMLSAIIILQEKYIIDSTLSLEKVGWSLMGCITLHCRTVSLELFM